MSNLIKNIKEKVKKEEDLRKLNLIIKNKENEEIDIFFVFFTPIYILLIYMFININLEIPIFILIFFTPLVFFANIVLFIEKIRFNKIVNFILPEILFFLHVPCLLVTCIFFLSFFYNIYNEFKFFNFYAFIDNKFNLIFIIFNLIFYLCHCCLVVYNFFKITFNEKFKHGLLNDKKRSLEIEKNIIKLKNLIDLSKNSKDDISSAMKSIDSEDLSKSDVIALKNFIFEIKLINNEKNLFEKEKNQIKKDLNKIINNESDLKISNNINIENN